MPKTVVYAICPVCGKQRVVKDLRAAKKMEALLTQKRLYGCRYEVGRNVWKFGRTPVAVKGVIVGNCVQLKNGSFVHPLYYIVSTIDGVIDTVLWKDVLPENTTDLRIFRGSRSYPVTLENYWNFHPELVIIDLVV